MKYLMFTVVSLALLGLLVEATPSKPQRPYSPRPTSHPRPIRVRRQAVTGQIVSNSRGGADAKVNLAAGLGNPDHNVIGNVFAAGNTDGRGPGAHGGSLAYNNNGLGASIGKETIPGVRDTVTKSLNANLFNNGVHSVDANVFKSSNQLANGFKFERSGGGLDYSHINGHGASLTQSRIPGVGSQLGLEGKANIWSSPDRNTRLDLTAGGTKWTSGVFSGKKDFNTGFGLTHFFG